MKRNLHWITNIKKKDMEIHTNINGITIHFIEHANLLVLAEIESQFFCGIYLRFNEKKCFFFVTNETNMKWNYFDELTTENKFIAFDFFFIQWMAWFECLQKMKKKEIQRDREEIIFHEILQINWQFFCFISIFAMNRHWINTAPKRQYLNNKLF